MLRTLRERLRFYGNPIEEILGDGRYKLRHQVVDDRKHPEEVKAEGDDLNILIEVFDGTQLTYQKILGVPNNIDRARRELLDDMRREIKEGIYDAGKIR